MKFIPSNQMITRFHYFFFLNSRNFEIARDKNLFFQPRHLGRQAPILSSYNKWREP